MQRYWVYFRGTNHGEYVLAKNWKDAIAQFAEHEGIPANSGYITFRRVGKA